MQPRKLLLGSILLALTSLATVQGASTRHHLVKRAAGDDTPAFNPTTNPTNVGGGRGRESVGVNDARNGVQNKGQNGNFDDEKMQRGQQQTAVGPSESRLKIEVLDKIKYRSRFEMSSFIENNLNYGDTGLYAEMIYNRAFQTAKDSEFSRPKDDKLGTGSLVGWNEVGQAKLELTMENPVSDALPASVRLSLDDSVTADNTAYRGYFGLKNRGFWGMAVRAREQYTVSFYIRADEATTVDMQYGLFDTPVAKNYGGAEVKALRVGPQWKRVSYNFTATDEPAERDDVKNVFAIIFDGRKGKIPPMQINLVSVFPTTWKNTTIRRDGAQAFLDFKPGSIRTPGGNDLSGFSEASRFHWEKAIGPLVNRPGRAGNWAGWNTDGLGPVEMYNFITALGAKIIVGLFDGTYNGDTVVAKEDLGSIVQEQVDFMRFLLDRDGKFADMRVSAGGPREPYKVTAVLIGNESGNTASSYEDRYSAMEAGLRRQFFTGDGAYPPFDIIATAPVKVTKGHRNNLDTLNNPLYGIPDDFVNAYHQYDAVERNGTIYYNLEFSVINSGLTHDDNIWSGSSRLTYTTLQSSLAEGVFLLGLERNGDICGKAAYAPQMAARSVPGEDQSTPGQLIFDPAHVVKSSSYLVQQAFGKFHIDFVHDVRVDKSSSSGKSTTIGATGTVVPAVQPDVLEEQLVYFSAGSDESGHTIVKLINYDAQPKTVDIVFPPGAVEKALLYTVTGSDPQASNTLDDPHNVKASFGPIDTSLIQGSTVTVHLKPYSLNAVAASRY